METSDSYLVVEKMICRGELGCSELEPLLDTLLEQKNISLGEQRALLALARALNAPNRPSQEGA